MTWTYLFSPPAARSRVNTATAATAKAMETRDGMKNVVVGWEFHPPPPETTAELTAGQTDRAVSSVGVVEENVGVELWFRNATLANQTYDASFS